MKAARLALLLLATVALPLDLPSYCKGLCQARWQDGFYVGGRCFCGDYQDIHPGELLAVPKRPREPGESNTDYGVDDMHYAPADPPPPLVLHTEYPF